MNVRVLRLFPALSTVLLSLMAPAQSPYKFKFGPSPGPYTVGLRVVLQRDETRAYVERFDELGKPNTGDRGRPIQTVIWYPAKKTSAPTVTDGDYLALSATEEGPAKGDLEKSLGFARGLFKTYLNDRMWAVRDAAPEPGRFPVVIYAPSFSAPSIENIDLCEFFASHGYVVLASPDLGAHQRGMTPDLPGIAAQAGDIGFLISYAGTLPNTDMSEIAVAGFSWGGISNLFAAARDSRIDALVSLDGSARYFPKLVKDSGDVHPDQIAVPILFFTSANMTLEDMARHHQDATEDVLNDLTHTDLTIVHMNGMQHGNFASMFQRMDDNGGPPTPRDYSAEEANEGYNWVARYTLAFLNATLKHDPAGSAFLKKTPGENGAPPHFITIDARPAQGLITNFDSFRGQLGQRGFDHASEVYAEFKKASPDFKLDESQVNAWGYLLIQEGHYPQAIAVMKLNIEINPKSTNAWDALGEAYRNSGDTANAIKSYEKAVEVDPNNTAVKAKLKDLHK